MHEVGKKKKGRKVSSTQFVCVLFLKCCTCLLSLAVVAVMQIKRGKFWALYTALALHKYSVLL